MQVSMQQRIGGKAATFLHVLRFRGGRFVTAFYSMTNAQKSTDSPPMGRTWPLVLALMLLVSLPAMAQPPATATATQPKVVVLPPTFEGSMGQPKILVRLSLDGKPLVGQSQLAGLGLNDMFGPGEMSEDTFGAYLDTGASAIVLSKETADRFGIVAEPEAVYHEAGLHGQTPMLVSSPFDLAIGASPDAMLPVLEDVRLQMKSKPLSGMMAMMGEINVVGMPAIERFVVEIDPMSGGGDEDMEMLGDLGEQLGLGIDLSTLGQLNKMLGGGTEVTLHPATYIPPADAFDYAVPLALVDFNRYKNPADSGPKPVLARNPMLRVKTSTADGAFEGDWLLDTGAAACIISTEHALALGLIDEEGNELKPSTFTLPLGGIGGDVSSSPGFVLDVLQLTTDDGTILEYHDVHVLVHDIGTTLDDGTEIVLDGIFGMNLLLPSVKLGNGFPTDFSLPLYSRIWIDTQRQRLVLKLTDIEELTGEPVAVPGK